MSRTRLESSDFAIGGATPATGFGAAAFPPAIVSSSGRGIRSANVSSIGFVPVPADDPEPDIEAADLDPCNETPRTLTPAADDGERPPALELADHVGADDEDIAGDAAVEEGVAPRGAGAFEVEPGGDTVPIGVADGPGGVIDVPGSVVAEPGGVVDVPDGRHAGGDEDGDP